MASLFRTLQAFGYSGKRGGGTRTVMRTGSGTRIGRRTHNARRPKVNNRPSVRRIKPGRRLF